MVDNALEIQENMVELCMGKLQEVKVSMKEVAGLDMMKKTYMKPEAMPVIISISLLNDLQLPFSAQLANLL